MKRKYKLSPDLKKIPSLYIYDPPINNPFPRETLLSPGFVESAIRTAKTAQETGNTNDMHELIQLISTSCYICDPNTDGSFFPIFKEFLSGILPKEDPNAAMHIWHFIVVNRLWRGTGQKSFLLSPSLYERLSHTRLGNIDMKDFRLPFPTFYVQFEKVNQGVFVEQTKESLFLAVLAPGVIQAIYTIPRNAVVSVEPDTKDAELAQVALCASIYLTTKNPDMLKVSETQGYRDAAKNRDRLRKKDRKLFDAIRKTVANVTWLGSRIRVTPRREAAPSAGGTHASPIPHWRQGHFRRQAIGPRGGGAHKTIWIEPQPIGFDGTEPPLSAALPRIREVKGGDS